MNNIDRRELVENHIALARSVANKHSGWKSADRPDLEDLYGEAYLGLVEAAKDWDPNIGPFIPYAIRRIKYKLHEADLKATYPIHMPKAAHKLVGQIRAAINAGAETIAEVAEATGINQNKVAELWAYRVTGKADIEPVQYLLEADQESVDEAAFDAVRKQTVAAALASLTEDERQVTMLRHAFGGNAPMTTTEIADQLGLMVFQVKELEDSARNKLLECQALWNLLDVQEDHGRDE